VKPSSSVRLTLALAAGVLLHAPARALDFTPQETWRALEGVRITVLLFSDPKGRIRYQPPGNWNVSGSGPTLALYPPNVTGAYMKMFVLGHAAGIPEIAAFSSDDLARWCRHYLATDAQEVKLLDENPSPFMLDGKPSREFIFDYKSSGQHYQTSVAVMDWTDREHLTVVITARVQDFKAIHDAGISSLFSWSLRKTEPPKVTPAPTAAATSPTVPGPTPIRAVTQ